jgi:DNA-3-methyladenine glycosylase II
MNNKLIKKPEYWEEAKNLLSQKDKVLAAIINQYKGESLMSRGSAFFSLARAIVGQQISVKAAESVWKKLELGVGTVRPDTITNATEEHLRSCGLSRSKVIYLKELSAFFTHNNDYDWHSKNDEEVITTLIAIKGIGKWSAEMFLIFHLMRPDVFPIADIGLQKAIEKHYGKGKKTTVSAMKKLSGKWAPYRTVATWYLWRSLDPVAVEY